MLPKNSDLNEDFSRQAALLQEAIDERDVNLSKTYIGIIATWGAIYFISDSIPDNENILNGVGCAITAIMTAISGYYNFSKPHVDFKSQDEIDESLIVRVEHDLAELPFDLY